MENVVILGSGISGSTAAIYAARAGLNPLVIAGPEQGGQLTLTTEVENFPGFPKGVMGPELVENAKLQAERFGARFTSNIVLSFEKKGGIFELGLEEGIKVQTKTLIIATGASARWLGIPSEQKFKGRGVSTCATCDGFFYKGKEILVIGGGDSAMEEATHLSKIASKVTVVHRRDEFKASKAMQDRLFKTTNISVLWNKEVKEILGDVKGVNGAKLKDTITGEITEIKTDGIFLALGHVPNTRIFKGQLDMDEIGYLTTNSTKTNIQGVFASGDVQDRKYRQAITAAGSGCEAALEAERFIHAMEHDKEE
ncbi:MAG: thioredoxin-disulfide reductase [Candidatus Nanoarchaeia archaeon]